MYVYSGNVIIGSTLKIDYDLLPKSTLSEQDYKHRLAIKELRTLLLRLFENLNKGVFTLTDSPSPEVCKYEVDMVVSDFDIYISSVERKKEKLMSIKSKLSDVADSNYVTYVSKVKKHRAMIRVVRRKWKVVQIYKQFQVDLLFNRYILVRDVYSRYSFENKERISSLRELQRNAVKTSYVGNTICETSTISVETGANYQIYMKSDMERDKFH